MYFIILIAIIYLCWGSDAWFALFLKNYWWQSWFAYTLSYIIIKVIIAIKREQQRFNGLVDKYGDIQIAQRIMDRAFWQGQTEDQLYDSLGKPDKIDSKVFKNKSTQIWRYDRISKRSFGLSITLENGVVVGWDKK
ncbi:MAG: hypothetical protein Q3971_06425 [Moraxella sp.]|nr:hypothetical protein [Moraxella sp.]